MNADAPDIDTPEASTFRASLHDRYSRFIPHSAALGMNIEAIGTRKACGRLHCRPEFVGDPDRGLIHNGVIISLIDSTFGCAVNSRIGAWQRIATLDLRVDYLRPALLGADILCVAECYRLARHIAFVRARVWQEDAPEAHVAEALATFMRAASRTQDPGGSGMSAGLLEARRQWREQHDATGLISHIPYAAWLGVRITPQAGGMVCLLPFCPDLVGNPTLPALHGGVIAGFMENAATLHLLLTTEITRVPKSVDFSIDYLRSARAADLYAVCAVQRQGHRVAQVQVHAEQAGNDPSNRRTVAVARVHFLL